MSRSIVGKIQINSFADIVGGKKDAVVEIPLADLYEFSGHPFRVLDDEKMDETVNSIKEHGVLIPSVVRPLMTGGYEIISGHRRKRACEIAGLETMPAIIKNYSDDEAVIAMVDSNIYREDILPSEKARAYKMKYEAVKHQGTSGGNSLDILSEGSNDSSKTIQRYIYLAGLSEDLLNMIDTKKIPLLAGVELSFLSEKEQRWVYDLVNTGEITISPSQATELKQYSSKKELTKAVVELILKKEKIKQRKLVLKKEKLDSYFDESVSEEEIEKTILMLLDEWKNRKGGLTD